MEVNAGWVMIRMKSNFSFEALGAFFEGKIQRVGLCPKSVIKSSESRPFTLFLCLFWLNLNLDLVTGCFALHGLQV